MSGAFANPGFANSGFAGSEPLRLYFVRAQFTELGSDKRTRPLALEAPTSPLAAALMAAAPRYQARALSCHHLPLNQLVVRNDIVGPLTAALRRSGAAHEGKAPTQAYLFTSANAVRALAQLGGLDQLDQGAPLFCVGSRALAALRDQGFDGQALQAPTAALLENAIIEGPLRTLGCGDDAARALHLHYFCATKVSHPFEALEAQIRAQGRAQNQVGIGSSFAQHAVYEAQALPDSDPRLSTAREEIQAAPDQALMLVYSRALARRLGSWLASAAPPGAEQEAADDWRARLPVLCLSRAIAVELESWDLRNISVAQTPDEDGLAQALIERLPGLVLNLDLA